MLAQSNPKCCIHTAVGMFCLVFFLWTIAVNAAVLDSSSFKNINMSADTAREAEDLETMYFEGHFILENTEWRLSADRATVVGRIDKPREISLRGEPAIFVINADAELDRKGMVARAEKMEYLRSANILILSGAAVLQLENKVVRSEMIEYHLDSGLYQSSGQGGVQIHIPAQR